MEQTRAPLLLALALLSLLACLAAPLEEIDIPVLVRRLPRAL